MKEWIVSLKRTYHKLMMNYHLELHKGCLDPMLKQQLYQKATSHLERTYYN